MHQSAAIGDPQDADGVIELAPFLDAIFISLMLLAVAASCVKQRGPYGISPAETVDDRRVL